MQWFFVFWFFFCERGRHKVSSATITANSLETGRNFLRINVCFALDNMVIQLLMTVSVFVVGDAETPLMIFLGRKWWTYTGSILFHVCRSIRTDGIIKRLTVYESQIERKESNPPSTDIITKEKARSKTKFAICDMLVGFTSAFLCFPCPTRELMLSWVQHKHTAADNPAALGDNVAPV